MEGSQPVEVEGNGGKEGIRSDGLPVEIAAPRDTVSYTHLDVYKRQSLAYDEMVAQSNALGAKGFLYKPFHREEFLTKLADIVSV